MMDKRQFYVHGTAARKLNYDIYEDNELLKRKMKEKQDNKEKRNILLHVFFCCTLALLMMYRYSLLTEMNYNIGSKYKEYEKIKNSNIELRVSIEKEENLSNIKEQARIRLGMQTVNKNQVVYVKVPTSDFVKYSDSNTQESGIVKIVTHKIQNLKKYF